MNVGAAASELSIKGFRRILPGSRDNKSRRSSFAIGRARSVPEAAASYAEIESSVGPQIEMDHLHFCIPPNDYVTLSRSIRGTR